jgi:tRNA A37 threonylcarbamoyladenosine biosynthesis protein TsaE
MKAFQNKTFKTYDFEGVWRASFGEPEQNFRTMVYGDSGNGKTDLVVQLAKYLAGFGRVYYNSFEEGESLTLQKAFGRHDLWSMEGKIILGDRENFDLVIRRMKARNSPRFCIIDSLDYMRMTMADYQYFVEELPHKSIIIISWSDGKKPKSQAAKDIEYMVDVKVRVHEYKAYVKCRFGGNEPFIIWPEYWENKAQAAEEAENVAPAKISKTKSAKPSPGQTLFEDSETLPPPEDDEPDGFFGGTFSY